MATKTKKRAASKRNRKTVAKVSNLVAADIRKGGAAARAIAKPLAGAMSAADMARSFNEWMRQYIETPEAFEAKFRTVNAFLAQEAQGREPDYGETSAHFMFEMLAELNGKRA